MPPGNHSYSKIPSEDRKVDVGDEESENGQLGQSHWLRLNIKSIALHCLLICIYALLTFVIVISFSGRDRSREECQQALTYSTEHREP